MANHSDVRLAELLGSLALATDLATGLPLEHSLRRTLIAVWLGRESGLAVDELRDTFYVALLGSVGCVLDGAAMACYVPDEISFRAAMFERDMAKPLVAMTFFARTVGSGQPPMRRAASLVGMARQVTTICRDVAMNVGQMLSLGPAVQEALGQCDEHWNGKASVLGLVHEQITVQARLFRLAQDIDVAYRSGGSEAAVELVQARSGTFYDPGLADLFMSHVSELRSLLEVSSTWDAALSAEPESARTLTQDEFDVIAGQIANVVDMRSAYTVGHSGSVAMLAEATACRLGMDEHDVSTVRSAGMLHDLGRAGVPVTLLDKADPLTADERARLERHPALTELMLARSSSLGELGTLAGLHHERLDGSGYRGVTAASIPMTARVLAAADAFQSKLEPRAYRPATPSAFAVEWIRGEASAGRLDPDVAHAMLEVGGQPIADLARTVPAGLTPREVDVLRLLVQGMSNRAIADALVLSPKTISRHLENVYAKTGVSTRVGATLFAIEHGVVANIAPPRRIGRADRI